MSYEHEIIGRAETALTEAYQETERLRHELAEALIYLRECRDLLTGNEGGLIPGGMGDFLKRYTSQTDSQREKP